MGLVGWIGQEPFEETPRFYDGRACPECYFADTAVPERVGAPGVMEGIRVRCHACGRRSEVKATWREALAAFYGPLPGRNAPFSVPVGTRVKVKESIPAGAYRVMPPLCVGDEVVVVDFEIGCYTVRRDDGVEGEVAIQNIGYRDPRAYDANGMPRVFALQRGRV